ncbi:hypothetical protein [Sphingomonas sp. 3-13AW]|uniref:hypothetical protein n=1 Tax=Sphingomonas sp. 3-13AW TaxID=3050450 RepID=UPI003BB768B8
MRTQDVKRVLTPILNLLADQDVKQISNIHFSFLAWGENTRRQIVGEQGFVTSLAFDAEEILSRPGDIEIRLPETLSFRDRTEDVEHSMFGMLHDD